MLALRRKVLPLLTLSLAAGSAAAAEVTQIPVTEVRSGAGMQQGLQSGQSQLLMMVQQLQEEVRQLRGQVETQQYQINKMKQEQLDRYRDTDRRLSAIINATAAGGGAALAAPSSSDSASSDAAEAAPAPTTDSSNQTAVASGDAQSAYQSAFQLVRERKFDEAQASFQAFISDYPDSDHVANAYYWIGEIQLAEQSLEQAQTSFNKVVSDYPSHVKVPDALYKLGVVQDRLGKREAAQGSFQRLIQDYPQSSAAGLARNYSR
ncbi:tol-pal system protein YbgF [Marinobacterium mangrovicola]|uniref:Cell division coordinator CpoB n=1 Tax=Marinobacterium mangrovicola TaxID=1476959 RepID=A0A4V2PEF6_9GAMM|nr:tol-pal system protein YbgF [Marinobacterium mangrovicola]TCK08836.1 tol-pal system protein YbgF [Marinobacterium mangrovicola]